MMNQNAYSSGDGRSFLWCGHPKATGLACAVASIVIAIAACAPAIAADAAAPATGATPAAPAPAAAASDAAAAVIAALEPLADHNVGLVRIFAKRMADTMTRYGVTIGPKLSGIALQPGQSNLSDAQIANIHQMMAAVIAACRQEPSQKPQAALPKELRVQLLDTIARQCPSSTASAQAAAALAQIALSPQPPVNAAAAAGAITASLYKCFDHVHNSAITKDDVAAFRLALQDDLLGSAVCLTALAAGKSDKAGLDAAVAEVMRRFVEGAEPKEAPNAEGSEPVLTALIARLTQLQGQTQTIVDLAQAPTELELLAGTFIAAVGSEDRPAVVQIVTPKMVKALDAVPSLRAGILGSPDVAKAEYLGVVAFGAKDGRPCIDVRLQITDDKSVVQTRKARLYVTRAGGGWKIGEP